MSDDPICLYCGLPIAAEERSQKIQLKEKRLAHSSFSVCFELLNKEISRRDAEITQLRQMIQGLVDSMRLIIHGLENIS